MEGPRGGSSASHVYWSPDVRGAVLSKQHSYYPVLRSECSPRDPHLAGDGRMCRGGAPRGRGRAGRSPCSEPRTVLRQSLGPELRHRVPLPFPEQAPPREWSRAPTLPAPFRWLPPSAHPPAPIEVGIPRAALTLCSQPRIGAQAGLSSWVLFPHLSVSELESLGDVKSPETGHSLSVFGPSVPPRPHHTRAPLLGTPPSGCTALFSSVLILLSG